MATQQDLMGFLQGGQVQSASAVKLDTSGIPDILKQFQPLHAGVTNPMDLLKPINQGLNFGNVFAEKIRANAVAMTHGMTEPFARPIQPLLAGDQRGNLQAAFSGDGSAKTIVANQGGVISELQAMAKKLSEQAQPLSGNALMDTVKKNWDLFFTRNKAVL